MIGLIFRAVAIIELGTSSIVSFNCKETHNPEYLTQNPAAGNEVGVSHQQEFKEFLNTLHLGTGLVTMWMRESQAETCC